MRGSQIFSAALIVLAALAWLSFAERPTRANLVKAILRTSFLR